MNAADIESVTASLLHGCLPRVQLNREAQALLKAVSRSFYLTLRVLPSPVRSQIGLAYLLARATDTVADTELLPVQERLAALDLLRDRIDGHHAGPVSFANIAAAQPAGDARGSNAEKTLLQKVDEAVAVLNSFLPPDQELIRQVLTTIVSGQRLDLQRFGRASANSIVALASDNELDDYTYRVAGCVGEFWTRMCRAHLFPGDEIPEAQLVNNGVRFGKGLQLVNILRDLPSDLRQGRCYMPTERLSRVGLEPVDLLNPANEPKFRPVFDELLDRAGEHLAAAWEYTQTLPRRLVRLRLACSWPILIGARTLSELRGQSVLDPSRRIKISRPEVRAIIAASVLRYPFSKRWDELFRMASRTKE